tara:strand:- start:3551 stop:4033 length:483 start_codon:yes stop_codon:yes gene_type:complete
MVKRVLSIYLVLCLVFPSFALAEGEVEEGMQEASSYEVVSVKKGDPVPFDGVLLSPELAAKVITDKKFEDAECDLRIGYELHLQELRYRLELDLKDVEIHSWKDKYESMMIIKSSEIDRLHELTISNKPSQHTPLIFAGGMTIGMGVALGIFAAAVQAAK